MYCSLLYVCMYISTIFLSFTVKLLCSSSVSDSREAVILHGWWDLPVLVIKDRALYLEITLSYHRHLQHVEEAHPQLSRPLPLTCTSKEWPLETTTLVPHTLPLSPAPPLMRCLFQYLTFQNHSFHGWGAVLRVSIRLEILLLFIINILVHSIY